MKNTPAKFILGAILAAGAGVSVAGAQELDDLARFKAENARLRIRNVNLQESLVEANRREKESAEALVKIKVRLQALGKDLLSDGDERTVEAWQNVTVLDRRLRRLEETSIRLSAAAQAFIKTAITADPEARAQLETHLRALEVELGLRNKPEQNIDRGNLQHALVKSIDEKSGLVVLNVGTKENARIGMVFNIMRGDQVVAEAMVADVRPDICGVFVQRLENDNNPVRFNDTASLKKK
ncbi:MAG TPA: hypothetical protein DCS85_09445 [Verrucomicrobiales bacterium]|nr:hypothetical protein [Verrucomicrobiales bacterium]